MFGWVKDIIDGMREAIMDGFLDFCDDEKFLALYKKLCRHVYYQYPQLVGEHVNLFRLQFEENNS